MEELEHIRLTAPAAPGTWVGVDPGREGGLAILSVHERGGQLVRAVGFACEWKQDGDEWVVTTCDGEWNRGPNLYIALAGAIPRFRGGEVKACVELTNIHGARAGAGKLLKATGYIEALLDVAGLVRIDGPQQTTWVADMLACHPGKSEAGVIAALKGAPLPGSRRVVAWGLRPNHVVDRMTEPGKRGRPRFGRHAGDAVALALWASGARLTRGAA